MSFFAWATDWMIATERLSVEWTAAGSGAGNLERQPGGKAAE
ncbi:hypothetical protein [Streptomyces sp. NE5-10]|nr:hypothetical protein [Streptomyces sp. NE5-10]